MVKKSENGLIDFSKADDSIYPVIEAGRRREAGRHMTAAQRRRAEKDRARNTRRIDLDPSLEGEIETLANDLGCSFSALARYLMDKALDSTDLVELRDAREPIRSMRYEFTLRYSRKRKNK